MFGFGKSKESKLMDQNDEVARIKKFEEAEYLLRNKLEVLYKNLDNSQLRIERLTLERDNLRANPNLTNHEQAVALPHVTNSLLKETKKKTELLRQKRELLAQVRDLLLSVSPYEADTPDYETWLLEFVAQPLGLDERFFQQCIVEMRAS